MRIRLLFAALLLIASASAVLFLRWADKGDTGLLLSDLRPLEHITLGEPSSAGNLLALELRLTPADYQDAARLQQKLYRHLSQASREGLITERTLVVLQAHIGTGLFAVGEKIEVQQARTLRDAMQWTALSNPLPYFGELFLYQAEDKRTEAVLRMKADSMSRAYQAVFSDLARQFGVTLIAGTIVLPSPRIEAGRLHAGNGPLQQVAVVFDPGGLAVDPLIHKSALSRYERRYLEPGENHLPELLQTPVGQVRLLLGCRVDITRQIPGVEAEIILHSPGDAECPTDTSASVSPRLQVTSQTLPWNLTGSPKKPTLQTDEAPGRLINLWLPEPPTAENIH